MSFQGYLKTIKQKTGKGPAEFRQLAQDKGFTKYGELVKGITATHIFTWLKADFDLGRGHGMAIYALLKGIKNEDSE